MNRRYLIKDEGLHAPVGYLHGFYRMLSEAEAEFQQDERLRSDMLVEGDEHLAFCAEDYPAEWWRSRETI